MLIGNILLAIAWTALRGEFSLANLFTGYLLGYVLLWALAKGGVLNSTYQNKTRAILSLAWFMLQQFLVANIRMAIDVIRPQKRMTPGILQIPLDAQGDYEILLLSTLINLTPGSLALDISDDRKIMYVHVMHVTTPEETRREIKEGFERRVMGVLGQGGKPHA